MLNTFEVNKVLIIAPLRVARDTWPAEIEKWDHLKNLDISIVVGDVKTRIAAVHHPAMIYVVNRENVKWLVEYYEKNGMRWDFSMVVIDELSSFKNYQSQRFKFLRKVRPYGESYRGVERGQGEHHQRLRIQEWPVPCPNRKPHVQRNVDECEESRGIGLCG